jgi:ankyrin repeat protein
MDLIDAAQKGNLNVIKSILDKGTDINAKDSFGASALDRASIWGHADIVKLLIANGADVNIKDNSGISVLMTASSNGHCHSSPALNHSVRSIEPLLQNYI